MKTKRHLKILELIYESPISTQEELLQKLTGIGYKVTQATVSRDIRELRLVKTRDETGIYRYTSVHSGNENVSSKFSALFSETVIDIDYAVNIVVVKCLTGMANAACAAVDSLSRPEIVGTISGDDTFICIMRDENKAIDLASELKKML